MSKLWSTAAEALAETVVDGATIAVGGFGLSGNPSDLIEALRDTGARDLTIVSNNMGVDGKGLGVLLENRQVRKVIASYVGENKLFAEQYLSGELEVEFTPQGTLAERLRAGGAGIAGFYTKTGVGTPVAEGKPLEVFDGETYVLERGIVADVALVHAWRADREGNLVYRHTARNFNPLVATAGRLTVAEAEQVVDDYLDPDTIVTPGIFVQRLVTAEPRVKDIEQRTVRPRPTAAAGTASAAAERIASAAAGMTASATARTAPAHAERTAS
ncbi:CoA transferase subunit A [Herbiconiux sp. CPCC 205716]|uniref:CoA transferase subunit A n=1 Tax=Herbiconiux gentiana TaxID=2970912 RepID=A0ABT2GIA5_9MICO|nr:CoA transferase subunit A [Herbiconiux gentiana]MCS5715961.1 CoA transferase subunit A [Herbiconiux gentiana]